MRSKGFTPTIRQNLIGIGITALYVVAITLACGVLGVLAILAFGSR